MKEQIKKITEEINNKKSDLTTKAESYFAAIPMPSNVPVSAPIKSKPTPPIAYILSGIAGLSTVGGMCSDDTTTRAMCLTTAAASAFGGWKFWKKKGDNSVNINEKFNINALKNEVTTKVIDSVKKLKTEWENFMESVQNDLQSFIQNSDIDEEAKDSLMSKIFVYEVLDINMSDFNNRMRDINDATTLRSLVNSFKSKVVQAIESAAQKQIEKYNSLSV